MVIHAWIISGSRDKQLVTRVTLFALGSGNWMTGVGVSFFCYMTFYIFERLNVFSILKIRINFKVDRGIEWEIVGLARRFTMKRTVKIYNLWGKEKGDEKGDSAYSGPFYLCNVVDSFGNGVWMYQHEVIKEIKADFENTMARSIDMAENPFKETLLNRFIRALVRALSPML